MFNVFKIGKEEVKTKTPQLPVDIQRRIIESIGDEQYGNVKDVVEKVYQVTRIFPSPSGENSLFEYLIESALNAHHAFKEYEKEIIVKNNTGNLSFNDINYMRKQFGFLSFLLGLLHDVGKVIDYKVIYQNYEVTLNILDVDDFIDKISKFDTSEIRVEKLPYRTDMIHSYVSAFLMHYFIPAKVLRNMDAEVLAKAVEAIALEHSPVALEEIVDNIVLKNLFLKILKGRQICC
jgi:hypothetical protein